MSNAGVAGQASTNFSADAVSAGNVTAFGETLVGALTPVHLGHFPYSINGDLFVSNTTGSGSVAHSGQFAEAHSGAATSSSGQMMSRNILEYLPGLGAMCRFACVFGTGTAGNTQIIGMGNDTDGYFFGYNGTSFGIMRRSGGTDTWIPQSSWSEDTFDGNGPSGITLDPTKGNVFQIKYQWLGFGAQRFYIENQNTGAFQLVHVIRYANQNTTTSTENPSFPFCIESKNTTNDTDVVLKNSSQAMFVEGSMQYRNYLRNAIGNTKTVSTETNIITIRNKSTYQSITNEVLVEPDYLSFASDGTKTATINVYLNPTVGGSPSFTDIDTADSVVDYDTAGTTVSGGKLIARFHMAKVDTLYVPIDNLSSTLNPADEFVVTATSTSNNEVSATIGWFERFA